MQSLARIFIVFGLTAPFLGVPGAAAELTLEAAVAKALDQNPSLQAQEAKAEAAQARSREAQGNRWPTVDLMETFAYSDNPAEVFAMTLNQERFSFDDFFMSDPNRPDALDTWITRLEVTQPIYTGGQLGARIEQADLMAEAASLDLGHRREQVAFQVGQAFLNARKALENVQLLERSLETTKAHVRLAEQLASQGVIIEADVLNARVHLARMEEMLLDVASMADVAQSALDLHMGVDQTIRHELGLAPTIATGSTPLIDWTERATADRRDLRARRLEVQAARLEEKAEKAGYLPEIGLVGRYDLYDDVAFGSNGSSGSVMAVAKINLFRGGQDSAGVEAARNRAQSAALGIEQMEQGIQLEVRAAFEAVQTARKRMATAENAVSAAREAHRVREHRFQQGLDKMIDLLDAETSLHDAEVRLLTANYDHRIATYRLYFLSGASLVEALGIRDSEE